MIGLELDKHRGIFLREEGSMRVFSDVSNGGNKYEDWYVHSSLVSAEWIERMLTAESLDWIGRLLWSGWIERFGEEELICKMGCILHIG
jgi:hypothetical protein